MWTSCANPALLANSRENSKCSIRNLHKWKWYEKRQWKAYITSTASQLHFSGLHSLGLCFFTGFCCVTEILSHGIPHMVFLTWYSWDSPLKRQDTAWSVSKERSRVRGLRKRMDTHTVQWGWIFRNANRVTPAMVHLQLHRLRFSHADFPDWSDRWGCSQPFSQHIVWRQQSLRLLCASSHQFLMQAVTKRRANRPKKMQNYLVCGCPEKHSED